MCVFTLTRALCMESLYPEEQTHEWWKIHYKKSFKRSRVRQKITFVFFLQLGSANHDMGQRKLATVWMVEKTEWWAEGCWEFQGHYEKQGEQAEKLWVQQYYLDLGDETPSRRVRYQENRIPHYFHEFSEIFTFIHQHSPQISSVQSNRELPGLNFYMLLHFYTLTERPVQLSDKQHSITELPLVLSKFSYRFWDLLSVYHRRV